MPQDVDLRAEYEQGWRVNEAFQVNVLGFQSHRDQFAIAFEEATLQQRIEEMRAITVPDESLRKHYDLKDNRDWKLSSARATLRKDVRWQKSITRCAYRPFDIRSTYMSETIVDYPRLNVLGHLMNPNLAFSTMRQTRAEAWQHFLVSELPVPAVYVEIKDGNFVFPLYLYPDSEDGGRRRRQASLFDEEEQGTGPGGRRPNLNPAFIDELAQRIGAQWIADGKGTMTDQPLASSLQPPTFGPEDVFLYAYAVFHSPTYRQRYAPFLKIDFPHLPLPTDRDRFAALACKGAELVDLHLLRLPGTQGVGGSGGAAVLRSPGQQGLTFPIGGTDMVDKVRYTEPQDDQIGRVYINSTQYFEGIDPATWREQIGGYQPLDKWLKDRKGRTLTFDDIQHYLRMAIALRETRRIMAEIDQIWQPV